MSRMTHVQLLALGRRRCSRPCVGSALDLLRFVSLAETVPASRLGAFSTCIPCCATDDGQPRGAWMRGRNGVRDRPQCDSKHAKSECQIGVPNRNAKPECQIVLSNRNSKSECQNRVQNQNVKSEFQTGAPNRSVKSESQIGLPDRSAKSECPIGAPSRRDGKITIGGAAVVHQR